MRTTFCLPNSGHLPTGGFKVVYEYANRLVSLGNSVLIYEDELRMRLTKQARELIDWQRATTALEALFAGTEAQCCEFTFFGIAPLSFPN